MPKQISKIFNYVFEAFWFTLKCLLVNFRKLAHLLLLGYSHYSYIAGESKVNFKVLTWIMIQRLMS